MSDYIRYTDEELWRAIDFLQGYDGYEASTHGRIKGKNGKILSGGNNKYKKFMMFNGIKGQEKCIKTAVAVANTFIENPDFDTLTDVDHTDRLTHNNHYRNLRFASKSQNSKNKEHHKRKYKKIIRCFNLNREFICEGTYDELLKNPLIYVGSYKAIREVYRLNTIHNGMYYFEQKDMSGREYMPMLRYHCDRTENNIWDVPEPILKPIKRYNSMYYVTQYGDVWSEYEKIWIEPQCGEFYIWVALTVNKEQHCECIHRLVCEHFNINSNPEQYNIANHIDADKHNNLPENLEWTDYKGNAVHANQMGLNPKHIPVCKFTIDGVYVNSFTSINKAAESLGLKQAPTNWYHQDIRIKKGYAWIDQIECIKDGNIYKHPPGYSKCPRTRVRYMEEDEYVDPDRKMYTGPKFPNPEFYVFDGTQDRSYVDPKFDPIVITNPDKYVRNDTFELNNIFKRYEAKIITCKNLKGQPLYEGTMDESSLIPELNNPKFIDGTALIAIRSRGVFHNHYRLEWKDMKKKEYMSMLQYYCELHGYSIYDVPEPKFKNVKGYPDLEITQYGDIWSKSNKKWHIININQNDIGAARFYAFLNRLITDSFHEESNTTSTTTSNTNNDDFESKMNICYTQYMLNMGYSMANVAGIAVCRDLNRNILWEGTLQYLSERPELNEPKFTVSAAGSAINKGNVFHKKYRLEWKDIRIKEYMPMLNLFCELNNCSIYDVPEPEIRQIEGCPDYEATQYYDIWCKSRRKWRSTGINNNGTEIDDFLRKLIYDTFYKNKANGEEHSSTNQTERGYSITTGNKYDDDSFDIYFNLK